MLHIQSIFNNELLKNNSVIILLNTYCDFEVICNIVFWHVTTKHALIKILLIDFTRLISIKLISSG